MPIPTQQKTQRACIMKSNFSMLFILIIDRKSQIHSVAKADFFILGQAVHVLTNFALKKLIIYVSTVICDIHYP